ncbi:hypothetical protein [Botrimarina mediterranea]|uniref:Tox-MPTase3 domain-containing protein n=1 Tax=Botrimarina mediterranea TaxID=2528022 RepID=A0A518K3U2_9BACT|nr:hypothetical protein [Botrimarina mediterranea]QDV72450.1 hypothetical protein Spa11_06270 [Botrimarina mediterranea]QDV77021.1 hypothetical protein K2D_06070 [Planctomycetes bacterium K2D]
MSIRAGLHIRGRRGHPEVRGAYIRYARWLRQNYEFPIRVPAYLSPGDFVTTMQGHRCSASFFAPWDQTVEPYIRIATGDYPQLRESEGRDNALAAFLNSLSHEIVHYFQWVETGEIWERGVVRRASSMVDRYALTVDHP